jgi:hypothetical protein
VFVSGFESIPAELAELRILMIKINALSVQPECVEISSRWEAPFLARL